VGGGRGGGGSEGGREGGRSEMVGTVVEDGRNKMRVTWREGGRERGMSVEEARRNGPN